MKIAITGSNGLLGQHLVNLLLHKQYQVIAMGKGEDRTGFESNPLYKYYSVDIASASDISHVFSIEKPAVMVHAAAMTQLDECEQEPKKCYATNVEGTAHAVAAAEEYCKHLLYVSTDFVFDGEKGNYTEHDETRPISYYGYTKQLAECLVQQSKTPWAIVRTCLVYGNTISGTRSNIISWVRKNLEEDKEIKVVSDQFRTPTYVEDLAKGILLMIEKKATGIYHISGKDLLTPYEMALQTADYLKLDKKKIKRVDASSFVQPAARPPKTGFDISRARNELGYEPISFGEGLQKMLDPKKG
jgi:dTDP-4-dehydrorhamnose reductase